MLLTLLIGSVALVINMTIQVVAIVIILTFLLRNLEHNQLKSRYRTEIRVLGILVLALFAGHLLQFAIWAKLFIYLGEFTDFQTAFYYSTVSFTSLGYGDIVMSERWRLLGALEAANGILMFGLSAGALLSVMTRLFKRRVGVVDGD
ncbi:MAG: potassium channel family protein [Lysobacterales bacterium]